MSTTLGCIADDFTGATDLAALMARSGVPVSLRIGIPDTAQTDTTPADTAPIEVIALKIRTEPAEQAVSAALKALHWLQKSGADTFFWKYCSTFDSTDKGNIGPVAEALMAALGVDQTLYCPAFPENGRSVYMGKLFVGRQLLSESPMKDHPLTPMRDSDLVRLLTPQTSRPVGLIDHPVVSRGGEAIRRELAMLRAKGVAHVVTDAVCIDDLSAIADAARDMPLLTGGSAVALSLPALLCPEHIGKNDSSGRSRTPPAAKAIVLSGSCSAMTRQQVTRYRATGAPALRLDPVELNDQGLSEIETWLSEQDLSHAPLIYATAEPDQVAHAQQTLGAAKAGELIEQALAHCALAARRLGARRFVIAGGETSGAVTKSLAVSRLDIGPEIAPGVPWTFCRSGEAEIALTLKSGNFGSPDFFTDALRIAEAS